MKNLATPQGALSPRTHDEPARTEPRLSGATLLVAAAGRYLVATADGQLEARRAASCLVEPTTGDRVLVAEADGAVFLLAVLVRDEHVAARVELPGGLELRAPGGRLSLAGAEVELTASTSATITSPTLDISAMQGKFFVDKLAVIGARIDAEIGKVALVADTIDTVADRLRQSLKRCYRFVKGLDQLRAGTLDAKVEGYARVHAHDQVMTADKLVKIDGEQIHMG